MLLNSATVVIKTLKEIALIRLYFFCEFSLGEIDQWIVFNSGWQRIDPSGIHFLFVKIELYLPHYSMCQQLIHYICFLQY